MLCLGISSNSVRSSGLTWKLATLDFSCCIIQKRIFQVCFRKFLRDVQNILHNSLRFRLPIQHRVRNGNETAKTFNKIKAGLLLNCAVFWAWLMKVTVLIRLAMNSFHAASSFIMLAGRMAINSARVYTCTFKHFRHK